MLSPPDSPRGKLLSQYVLARVVQMDRVNIGLFDYDRYNTLYYFALNTDEQIYLRYGGRDAAGHTSYLNTDSIDLALKKGLELHEQYKAGKLAKTQKPEPLYPQDIPALYERTTGAGRCVECHLIGDLQNVQRERDGTLDKVSQMYRSPNLKTIGVQLDVPKGLVVKEATGAALEAGMQAGDHISSFNGIKVWTFGDLQYYYDQIERDSKTIRLGVDRGGEEYALQLELPPFWWWTDLAYRNWTIEPRVYFRSEPLSEADKSKYELEANGFASRVTHVETIAELMGIHSLKVGDVIFAVDDDQTDDVANRAELFIKLRRKAGDAVSLGLIREGKRMTLDLKTARMSFRK